jgi:hypothetical protein
MIPLWKGKNPIYFGIITIIPFDNLYRRAYFVMHTFLVLSMISSLWDTPAGVENFVGKAQAQGFLNFLNPSPVSDLLSPNL